MLARCLRTRCRSDGGGHPQDSRCDEGPVYVEDGLESLFEMVLRATGVELHDLAHENETSADESASPAGEEEAPPLKDPIPMGAAGLTPPLEAPLPNAQVSFCPLAQMHARTPAYTLAQPPPARSHVRPPALPPAQCPSPVSLFPFPQHYVSLFGVLHPSPAFPTHILNELQHRKERTTSQLKTFHGAEDAETEHTCKMLNFLRNFSW